MSTAALLTLELFGSLGTAAAWIAAGVTRRAALFVTALVATAAHAGVVAVLAGRGWWFVQDKVWPLIAVVALAAVAIPKRSTVTVLATGYAASAGLLSALLFGFPMTWSRGLILGAVVAGATVVTGGRAPAGAGFAEAKLANQARKRRGWLVFATAAAAVTGLVLAVVPAEARDGHRHGDGIPVTALRGPASAPGARVRTYSLEARTAQITLSSGRRVAAWTFNGQVPGPSITATKGDLVEVTLRNVDIAAGVTLHWHGYDVPAGEDGAPGLTQDAVPPGGQFVYRFAAEQAGTFWYHTHEASDPAVKKGLYGTLVVAERPDEPDLDLTVPVHTLNGVVLPEASQRTVANGTPVRLRLVNTDSTPHRFTLAGTPFRLAAVDGSDLNAPGELTRTALRLAAGGRYDLRFAMPDRPVTLLVDGKPAGGVRLAAEGPADEAATENTGGWPELDLSHYGEPAAVPFGPGSRFDRRFTMVLDRGLVLPRYAFTVNGQADPDTTTQVVREGDLVEMTVVNRSRDPHPWHLHGHHVLVLSVDGRPVRGSPLWMDTFDVRPGEVWVVGFRADNPGLWMNHCHNLTHAAQGMAVHLVYEGVAGP